MLFKGRHPLDKPIAPQDLDDWRTYRDCDRVTGVGEVVLETSGSC